MNILIFLLKTCANACLWGLLFLACRLAAWAMRWPAWRTIPLALGIGFACLILSRVRDALRERRAENAAAEKGEPVDPHQSARMRRAWRQGGSLRRSGPFQPAPVWHLCLDQAPTRSGGVLDCGDAADRQSPDCDEEFSWRRGPNALWLEYPDARVAADGGRWNAFLRILKVHEAPLAGVVVTMEADHLLLDNPGGLRADAVLLRRRLEQLRSVRGETAPVYLIVNRIDCLYGMRSLTVDLARDRLASPLGAVRRERETPEDLARRVIDLSKDELASLPPRHAAAIQTPAELDRLRRPLAHFCSHLFEGGASGLRGIYLAASAPGGGTIPPLMVKLPTFRELDEEPPHADSWFLRNLLREGIPGDAPAARRAVGSRGPVWSGALAGLAACSLVLCSLLTWSFLENRTILLSARGRATPPDNVDSLGPYLDLAVQTRLRAQGWRLPRFGMTEAEKLADELQQRYTESYFDLKTVPGIDHVQEAALAAAASDDPREIGNALLLLAATRDGLTRNLDDANRSDDTSNLLHALVDALRLASPEDMRQLDIYFAWAGSQEWMPATRDALIEFEKHIVDHAAGGDLSWLPQWVETLPGLVGIDVARVWDPVLAPPRRIGGAWTAEGYRIASGLLEAVAYDAADTSAWREKRDAFLAEYRKTAIKHWREAAARLWDGFRQRLRDGDIPELVRAASHRDDPASRFVRLAKANLIPMHADQPDNPDIAWLTLHGDQPESDDGNVTDGLAERLSRVVRKLGSDDGIDRLTRDLGLIAGDRRSLIDEEWERFDNALFDAALQAETPLDNLASIQAHYRGLAAPDDPLRRAGETASVLHRLLRETSGTAAWDGVSPLASFDLLRYLAARSAGLGLDAAWREQVYNPARLRSGDDAERLRLAGAPGGPLEKFLLGSAAGFWRWDGDRLANAVWDSLDFVLAPSFLEFCQTVLQNGAPSLPETIVMPFRANAASVDRDALERPVSVEFILKSGGKEQKAVFRNYSHESEFVWHAAGVSSAAIRLIFPSTTAQLDFPAEALGDFFRLLSNGEAVIGIEAFPDSKRDLRQLGVSRVAFRVQLDNVDAYFARRAAVAPQLPESIIAPDNAPSAPVLGEPGP